MEKMKKSLYGWEVRKVDKRRVPDGEKVHDIQQLWQRSHEILGLALQGLSNKDIAKELKVHPGTVSDTINSELGKKKLSELRKERDGEFIDVSKKINEIAEKALKVYDEILDSETISYDLKKKTADTVLMDIGGHRAPTQIQSQSISTTATFEEIEEFKRIGHLAAKDAGYLIEIPKIVKEESSNELEEMSE